MDPTGLDQKVDRHNPVLVGLVFLMGAVSLFLALCMGILVLVTLLPLRGFTFQRLTDVFWWAMGTLAFGAMAPGLWQIGAGMAFSRVSQDGRGVAFRLGTRKQPVERFFPWDRVAAVWHRRKGNAQYYGVQSLDGTSVEFSSYAFLRPGKLARQIAAQAGKPLQEL